MNETSRLKRPEPARTAPIRGGWLNLFAEAGEREATGSRAEDGSHEKPPASDPVARAVELGYRVVDDYVRQGQGVARRFTGQRSATPAGFGSDVQDLMTRWFQYTSELTEVWFQLVGMAAAGQMPRAAAFSEAPPAPPAAAGAPPVGAPTGAPMRVGVEVSCSRPVEVVLDLRPLPAATRLCAHDLRAADPDKPRISGVRVECAQDGSGARVCIQIHENQPPGIYSGLVLDEATSLPAGTVAVRIP